MINLISKKIRGFRDILPEESKKFQFIEHKIHDVCPLFNINQVRIPALESINLFNRSIGETSDIVTKEMYTFNDKNDDVVCMTPEGTASCMRLAFENNLVYDRGVKKNRLYYYSPMFRHERPQKGRYRQFTQFGVEFMGNGSTDDDIDLLQLSSIFFREIDLKDISLHINSLGSTDERAKYSTKLKDYFNKYSNSFNNQQINTINRNPLRLLDNKDSKLEDVINNSPVISDYLGKSSLSRFEDITNSLSILGIDFTLDTRLVRGLDYYNDLVFEWKTDKLGTQDAICAGGRYDSLSKSISDIEIPAVGFAMGVDRIVELININNIEHVIGLSVITDNKADLHKVSSQLRQTNTKFRLVQMDIDKSLSKQIKSAVKHNCDILIIVGSDEISNNMLTVKYLKENKDDQSISQSEFSNLIKEL